jgi:predicted nucleic acid-binding protein
MDPKGSDYALALQANQDLAAAKRGRVVTEWVLAEFLSYTSKPPLRALAIGTVEHLRRMRSARVVPATSADWQLGYDLYKARDDKSWSLVDCISIVICERLGITDVFTADHHFEQAGLRILVS